MNKQDFTFYGWRLSWYSAKVRSYLQHKNIPFTEKRPSLYTFKRTIPRHCGGDAVVPVLVTPEGEWLQDSTVILEQLEHRFVDAPILPGTPVQRFFSLLVEIWADEFWHPSAEHYRFSFPEENFAHWRDELRSLLPGFPSFIQDLPVNYLYKFMLQATRDLGVEPRTFTSIERWTETQLDTMDRHFASMPYLLGTRASLADFALMGPINGHLAWDPRSVKVLIEPRKHLHAWIKRMSAPSTELGAFIADDRLPDTLAPMTGSLFKELVPYLEHCVNQLGKLGPQSGSDPRYPRLGPAVDVPYGEGSLHRIVLTYTTWMLQRVLDQFRQLPPQDAERVRAWLIANGGERLLSLQWPRVRRVGLHVAAELAPQ